MPQSVTHEARLGDSELARRAASNDEAAIREIMSRNNRRLYRIARSMLRDDGEAEDALQEAYLKAFTSLASFRGDALLSTWLTRIVVNQALQRLRQRVDVPTSETDAALEQDTNVVPFSVSGSPQVDPERAVAQKQITRLIEVAIDELPDEFRTVLVARVIEDMSVEETAELLNLNPETVKTRLHRARRMIKEKLSESICPLFEAAFPFGGRRCARLTDAVVGQLEKISGSREPVEP